MCPLELEGGDLPKGLVLFYLLSVIKRKHFPPFEVKQSNFSNRDFLYQGNFR